jgi:hypothetical protein
LFDPVVMLVGLPIPAALDASASITDVGITGNKITADQTEASNYLFGATIMVTMYSLAAK